MNMIRRKFKINIKEKLVRKSEKCKNFKKFIINVIKINDDWYKLKLQKKFKKFEDEKIKFIREKFIKYRRNKFIKKWFYDNKIVSMKLNFI